MDKGEKDLKGYRGYLFDMDGTLVGSEPLKGLALAMACRDYGAETDPGIYKDVMGGSWEVVTGHFFRDAGIDPEIGEFNRLFRRYYEELLSEDLKVNRGAAEYLKELKKAGKACAIVSSAAAWMVDNILEQTGLHEHFDVVICQEDVAEHKPHPEAYLLALDRLGLSPEEVLIFEDSSAGVEAGAAAGCDVVAFRHEFNGRNDLSRAIKIIEGYDEI